MSSTGDGIEREVKLGVGADFVVPALDLDGRLVVEAREPKHLDAVYWDTADRRLQAQRITVRRRTGEGTRWTLKFPTAEIVTDGLARKEIDVVTDATEPPSEVLDLLAGHLDGGGLVPIARLVSDRARLRLTTPDGTEVAELDDDRVAVHPAAGSTAGSTAGPDGGLGFREVEVEFGPDADAELVAAVVERLIAAGADRATGESKVAHALALLDAAGGSSS